MAEAFLSVHDMIHAAIRGQGGTASLRQIYAASQARGRIIYKRAGGSRLITSNEHWKSQIRHALYTSGRFRRAPGSTDEWQMAEGFGAGGPSTALIEVSVGEDQRQSAESAARAAARKGGRGAAKPRADRLVATGAPKRTSRGGGRRRGEKRTAPAPSAAAATTTTRARASVPAAAPPREGGGAGGRPTQEARRGPGRAKARTPSPKSRAARTGRTGSRPRDQRRSRRRRRATGAGTRRPAPPLWRRSRSAMGARRAGGAGASAEERRDPRAQRGPSARPRP